MGVCTKLVWPDGRNQHRPCVNARDDWLPCPPFIPSSVKSTSQCCSFCGPLRVPESGVCVRIQPCRLLCSSHAGVDSLPLHHLQRTGDGMDALVEPAVVCFVRRRPRSWWTTHLEPSWRISSRLAPLCLSLHHHMFCPGVVPCGSPPNTASGRSLFWFWCSPRLEWNSFCIACIVHILCCWISDRSSSFQQSHAGVTMLRNHTAHRSIQQVRHGPSVHGQAECIRTDCEFANSWNASLYHITRFAVRTSSVSESSLQFTHICPVPCAWGASLALQGKRFSVCLQGKRFSACLRNGLSFLIPLFLVVRRCTSSTAAQWRQSIGAPHGCRRLCLHKQESGLCLPAPSFRHAPWVVA